MQVGRSRQRAARPLNPLVVCHQPVQVDPDSGADLFLIRWWGFSAWWDSWEGADCLDAPPNTYSWHGVQAAIPAKFTARVSPAHGGAATGGSHSGA
jgi:hypothetical protein